MVGNQAYSPVQEKNMAHSNVKKYAVIGGAFVVTLVASTFALPRYVHVERSSVVSAPPAAAYEVFSKPVAFHGINPFREIHPDLKMTMTGPTQGVGAAYAWEGKGERGSQTIIAVRQDAEVRMQLELGAQGRPLQTFTMTPISERTKEGTKVTWAMDADLGYNPIARVIGQTLEGRLGSIYQRGLQKLSESLAANPSSNGKTSLVKTD
jgi:Polyketide cyclase / dehydrase and lipid transport